MDFIACGWDITGCITSTKKLYLWGSNAFQQLGICQRGFNAVRRPMPVKLPRGDIPLRLSFGLRHCAILTQNHNVYIFGKLRISDQTTSDLTITHTTLNNADVLKIHATSENEMRITSITSGQNHILLKIANLEQQPISNRRIIALGDNKFGQSNSFYFEEDILQISVGWTHNAVLLKNHQLFLWGRNCYGQLGNGGFSDCVPIPKELILPNDELAARIYLGSEHCLVRSMKGNVYTWGWNEHGNCGNSNVENV